MPLTGREPVDRTRSGFGDPRRECRVRLHTGLDDTTTITDPAWPADHEPATSGRAGEADDPDAGTH